MMLATQNTRVLAFIAMIFVASISARAQDAAPATQTAKPGEQIRNDKVVVLEQTLSPGQVISAGTVRPGVIVWLDDGSIESGQRTESIKRGQVSFRPAQSSPTKNVGSSDLRLVWIEYLTEGNDALTWGSAGLAPNYKLLSENRYGRVYDIRMEAGGSEPQHSHHDRVVVCLSGALLEHIMPDGHRETSTLATGEITWRLASTHIGHNTGKTDLWVIAVEPK